MSSRLSKLWIKSFIRKNGIDMERYEAVDYRSYNDFFTRRLREQPTLPTDPHTLFSPCDAKLSAYPITEDSRFTIKNGVYSVAELLENPTLAAEYEGGLCLIFRLAVDDYHRYCYIDSGTKEENVFIPGVLHTVQPIALEKYDFYKRNCREYTVLHTEHFGDVIQVEVGALMVGRIVNRDQSGAFVRGNEKGNFEFGGSTIVLLFKKGAVTVDSEILGNSVLGYETVVHIGEEIGSAL